MFLPNALIIIFLSKYLPDHFKQGSYNNNTPLLFSGAALKTLGNTLTSLKINYNRQNYRLKQLTRHALFFPEKTTISLIRYSHETA